MRCVLIYNPAAGRNRRRPELVVERIADTLRGRGHTAEVIATTGPATASALAREAAARADVIFACGGDGTVHGVIQGLVVETGEPSVSLGVIPLGSANALARHMRIPLDPVTAALRQIDGQSCIVPVGKVSQNGGSKYFMVMVGAGPDGALVSDLFSTHKSQMGRLAYDVNAARLFFSRRFDAFEVEWTRASDEAIFRRKAVEVMAVRIGNMGGILAGLTDPRATIHDTTLRLNIVSGPAWLALPLWFLLGWMRVARLNPFVQCIEASSFRCTPIGAATVHAQIDGEWLGTLPFEVSVAPQSLRVLLPG